jgi:hypothetical protein
MACWVNITLAVPPGYRPGDYARLCWDAGTGTVDYANPVSTEKIELFPNRCGAFGYGLAPYGKGPYGHAVVVNALGYAKLPYGRAPYGRGTCLLRARYRVTACGSYKFGLAVYDAAGNRHSGSSAEIAVTVHTAPPAPTGLRKVSYNPATDVLILAVAS